MYSFVLFIVFNHCVSELGSHEKVLYRKEDVAREKTQFFQKTVFLGKKTRKKNGFFPGDSKFPLFWNPIYIHINVCIYVRKYVFIYVFIYLYYSYFFSIMDVLNHHFII